MNGHPPEPTTKDCEAKRRGEWNGHPTMALWYPQMGGYVGRAVAVATTDDVGCLDVYVWHDGEFPFTSDDVRWADEPEGRKAPAKIHHCDVEQFREFADDLAEFP